MLAIELIKADITQLHVDAIVNAAKNSLRGGGGVDGAIHHAAGPQLLDECMVIGGCPTGEARITKGYNLKAVYVIHTVGPVWQGGENNECRLLADCYRNSLSLAVKNKCSSIAFPNISTGIYGFPKVLAAGIAVREVQSFLASDNSGLKVLFCCYDDENHTVYKRLLQKTHL